MYTMVGLMVSTGIEWEYWAEQDEEVVATALDILKRINGKASGTQSTSGVQMKG